MVLIVVMFQNSMPVQQTVGAWESFYTSSSFFFSAILSDAIS
jgi:hypothetical protein